MPECACGEWFTGWTRLKEHIRNAHPTRVIEVTRKSWSQNRPDEWASD